MSTDSFFSFAQPTAFQKVSHRHRSVVPPDPFLKDWAITIRGFSCRLAAAGCSAGTSCPHQRQDVVCVTLCNMYVYVMSVLVSGVGGCVFVFVHVCACVSRPQKAEVGGRREGQKRRATR